MLMVYSAQNRISESKCELASVLIIVLITISYSCKHNSLYVEWLLCFTDPLIVRRVMNIISSEIISDSLMSQAVLNLKEEWMQ